LQVKVSTVKPGGRAFQRKRRETAELRAPEVRTGVVLKQSHRAGGEVRTPCVVGSTHRASSGKYAQSVDFGSSTVRDVQLTQGAAPPATPQPLATSPETSSDHSSGDNL
jgi:hypothetical protein